jgi:hypothetical protein
MNITVALALDYKRTDIAPFLNSFQKYSSGVLYLITNQINILENKKYSKIKLVNIFDLIKQFNINIHNLTVFNLKPVIFYLFLKQYKTKVDIKKVILTDVDLFFQYDPFVLLDKIKTETFLIAEEGKKFFECDTNTTWFNAGYHEQYDKVKDQKILNCGFTVGYYDAVLDYQKQVVTELQHILATRPYFAYDQVILNVLTYSTKTITPTILPHGNPYVAHMHYQSPNLLTPEYFTSEMLNEEKKPYCVIHQYNDKEIANNFVQKKWIY